jgi:hypothetical protein
VDSTQPTQHRPSPAPRIGTPAEQTTHRPPAPTPAQHNAAHIATHGPTPLAGFDSTGQCPTR